ncbi:Response regulator receiver domain-containing protein [Sphingomonas palmae]|uniref:Response regulator receiver domain-containing protein n=1 Tax=Sphingomonas palmae TaxID=1855283 RepID=A0A1H7L2S1_9SPHN|nr:response regulator [Sphingomonas palmae]SEK92996.1 Response regulator receiver domain-containing protein [Sphingomonas palmae]
MLTYPKVVVADDEIINIRFLEHCLTHAGWQVMSAQDGQQAVDLVASQRPDLVMLDINMPVLDGWQAAAAIRGSSGAAAGMPIIAFTSLRVGEDELRRRGFDGCLSKPCDPAHLVQEVARWRPGGELGGVERLAAVFAPAELDALIKRLRDQLAEAIANAPDPATAHRIAGAAGTLGFAQVSESWLALSTGEDSARARAYADARRAIAAIDRRLCADRVTG